MSDNTTMRSNPTVVYVNDGLSDALQNFPCAQIVDPPEQPINYEEIFCLDSTDNSQTWESVNVETGTFSFTYPYNRAEYARCLAIKGVTKTWRIHYPDFGYEQFSGQLMDATPKPVGKQRLMNSVKVKVLGPVQFVSNATSMAAEPPAALMEDNKAEWMRE